MIISTTKINKNIFVKLLVENFLLRNPSITPSMTPAIMGDIIKPVIKIISAFHSSLLVVLNNSTRCKFFLLSLTCFVNLRENPFNSIKLWRENYG